MATRADVSVVVDVLSFSTSVTIAVGRGMRVFPYRWQASQAESFALENDAALALGRLEAGKIGAPAPSLSPAGLLTCEPLPRLVLPSPNGSSIAFVLQAGGSTIAIGCLRNAQAVAEWLAAKVGEGRSAAVIAAGERWSHDDSLRPALEDHLGAGAILSSLVEMGYGSRMSPEAIVAAELFDAAAHDLDERMRECVGGRELARIGFGDDVVVASALNASTVVPILINGAFDRAL